MLNEDRCAAKVNDGLHHKREGKPIQNFQLSKRWSRNVFDALVPNLERTLLGHLLGHLNTFLSLRHAFIQSRPQKIGPIPRGPCANSSLYLASRQVIPISFLLLKISQMSDSGHDGQKRKASCGGTW